MKRRTLPLIYSCSGCSNNAQIANAVALGLHRDRVAEMSCIAGVGGDVPALVRVATSGRPIVALDGCDLRCVESALARHGVTPSEHHVLSDLGIRKRQYDDFDPAVAASVRARVEASLRELSAPPVVREL